MQYLQSISSVYVCVCVSVCVVMPEKQKSKAWQPFICPCLWPRCLWENSSRASVPHAIRPKFTLIQVCVRLVLSIIIYEVVRDIICIHSTLSYDCISRVHFCIIVTPSPVPVLLVLFLFLCTWFLLVGACQICVEAYAVKGNDKRWRSVPVFRVCVDLHPREVQFIMLENKDKQAKQSGMGKARTFGWMGEMQGLDFCKVMIFFFAHTPSSACLRWTQKVCNIAFMLKPMSTIEKSIFSCRDRGFLFASILRCCKQERKSECPTQCEKYLDKGMNGDPVKTFQPSFLLDPLQ